MVRPHVPAGRCAPCPTREAYTRSWEHKRLRSIVEELGAQGKVKKYPRDAFDLIWTDPPPYHGIVDVTSQHCPGLPEEM